MNVRLKLLTMDELSLYFIVYSVREEKEWAGYAGYIFAKNRDNIFNLLKEKFEKTASNGDVLLHSAERLSIEEGTILYGKKWKTI